MNAKSKTWALLFLGTAVFSLIVLASSLSSVETGTARPVVQILPQEEQEEVEEESTSLISELDLTGVRRGFTFIITTVLVAGFAYLIWRISKLPAPRERRQSYGVFSFIIILLALYLITNGFADFGLGNPTDRPVLFIGAPTLVFAFFVGFVPLALIGGYVFFVWRKNHLSALELLAQEADDTVAEVEAGGDIRNAVISCYHRMCLVLQEERRMVRQEGKTPREFADRLEGAGLPYQEVVELTRLFEAVRYGAHQFSPGEAKEALECLKAIRESAKNYQPQPRNVPWSKRSAHLRS